MDEDKLELKIDIIAITTLKALQGVFKDFKLDDRQATLSLYYYLNKFIEGGWKNNNPVEILENAIEVIKDTLERKAKSVSERVDAAAIAMGTKGEKLQ